MPQPLPPSPPQLSTSASKAGSQKDRGHVLLGLVLLGPIIPFGLPTLLLVAVGLTPTWLALVMDRGDSKKLSTITVGFSNFAGLVPFVAHLWRHGQTFEVCRELLQDPLTWFMIVGGGTFGIFLLYTVPSVVKVIERLRCERRMALIREAQKAVIDVWGNEVTTRHSPSEVRALITKWDNK